MGNVIKIKNRKIGDNYPVFIIAELSANHLQKFSVAVRTIRAIKNAGADAVKIQTYTPDTMTINSNKRYFRINRGELWKGNTLFNLYKEAYTPWEWQPKLKRIAESMGLICFSTPFDESALNFLEKINMPAYKIASFEITDIPLIEQVASKRKPIIISTGIARRPEIRDAIQACKKVGNNKIALLKCTSAYPALPKEANLRLIPRLKKEFNCVVGISDHSLSSAVAVVSVVLGARIVEKHFILNRKMGGPDSAFSLEPDEFALMVKLIRETEMSLGSDAYTLPRRAEENRVFARSLFVVERIKKGDLLTKSNVRSIRPGQGLPPKYINSILGRRAARNIEKGTPLSKGMIR
jgi:pseudaminic acid synthase